MDIRKGIVLLSFFIVGFMLTNGIASAKDEAVSAGDKYEDLVSFFTEWREFQKPEMVNGVPDYSAQAMAEQKRRIPEFKKRLAAFDINGWTVPQRVDYELIRIEMNGLEFDHRVMRPWSRNPIFYAAIQTSEPDVPAREGTEIYGVLNIFDHSFPLDENSQAVFKKKLAAIPDMLSQAKQNLVEDSKDLWSLGIWQKRSESRRLAGLARRLEQNNPDLAILASQAQDAVEDFLSWLQQPHVDRNISSGIGIAEYDRYMKDVHMIPYNWHEQLVLLERELERSMEALALEQHKNRNLPPLKPAGSLTELQERKKKAVAEFMGFLSTEEIFTVPDYMQLSDEARSFTPPERRDFFSVVSYYDPLPLLCHSIHWLEKQREAQENVHPIRSVPLLYNIWYSRAEGLATCFEELMLQAGMFDKNPRAKELVYILLAFRAVRAIADLKLHSGEFTLDEAIQFAVAKTPNGWLKPNSNTIWLDYSIYLSQPGYGTSYVIGKIQLEKLIADWAIQSQGQFRLKDFLDDYFTRGIIPASLLRWEMTGLDDEIVKLKQ